jgi:hypothetical protein
MKPRNEEAYAPEKGLLSHKKDNYQIQFVSDGTHGLVKQVYKHRGMNNVKLIRLYISAKND